MPGTIRRRIEQSPLFIAIISAPLLLWLHLCWRTIRWTATGTEAVAAAAAKGPVLVVLWHEHVLFGGANWDKSWRPMAILHDLSPAARVAGQIQRSFGMSTFAMSSKLSNLAVSREVLRLIRSGTCLGIAGDGPRGPRRVLKDAPLEWARAAGVPVFVNAFAVAGQRRFRTWDRLVLPVPFARGRVVFHRWESALPRRADAATYDALRADLQALVTAAAEEAGAAVGLPAERR